MKTNLFILFLICVAGLQSCYKDKGNYDYTKLPEVQISMTDAPANGYVGESYTYVPEVIFENPNDSVYYKYWWEYTSSLNADGKPQVQEGKKLNYIPTNTGRFGWQFCMQDTRNNVVTSGSLYITVTAAFNRGWLVLSNDNGRSVVSFIRPQWNTTPDGGKVREYVPYIDLNKEQASLGTNPTGLYQALKSTGSIVLLKQESGPVWLNGNSFLPEVLLNDEFLGGSPAGFQLKDYTECSYLGVALAKDGRLFSRYMASTAGYYTDDIMNFPTEYYGEIVHATSLIPLTPLVGVFGLYDEQKKRVLWINNDYFFPNSVFPSVMSASGDYLDFAHLDDKRILYCSTTSPALANAPLTTIYSKGGQFYVQSAQATFNRTAMQNVTLTVSKDKLFAGNDLITQNSKFFMLETRPYLFFAEKNNVYWYDLNTETVHNIYTFPAGENVVAMGTNPQESELGVTLENGTFATLDIANDQLYANHKIWETHGIPGKVIDLKYKFDNGTTYANRVRITSYWD
ncbi:PKD-like family protein [bacterium A37T11]|nr:PKD-like family protein [bacterium A37T11]